MVSGSAYTVEPDVGLMHAIDRVREVKSQLIEALDSVRDDAIACRDRAAQAAAAELRGYLPAGRPGDLEAYRAIGIGDGGDRV